MTSAPWSWPASTITRVKDGDSIVARVSRDIGFHGVATFEQNMRLSRINTPPASTTEGKAATVLVRLMTTDAVVDITTTKPYKYGDEWMAEVTLPDGSKPLRQPRGRWTRRLLGRHWTPAGRLT